LLRGEIAGLLVLLLTDFALLTLLSSGRLLLVLLARGLLAAGGFGFRGLFVVAFFSHGDTPYIAPALLCALNSEAA
jgi:hypothetical protein